MKTFYLIVLVTIAFSAGIAVERRIHPPIKMTMYKIGSDGVKVAEDKVMSGQDVWELLQRADSGKK